MVDSQNFRTTALTLLGAAGYLTALVMAGLSGVPWYSLPLEWVLVVLLTSSALLGVDFGLDVFGVSKATDKPRKPNGGE